MEQDTTLLYFAYGSNMDEERIKSRLVTYSDRVGAILSDYELVFNKVSKKNKSVGFANIIPAVGLEVEGALYTLNNQDDFAKLDYYEGFPDHYVKKYVNVVSKESGEELVAITYIANQNKVLEGLRPTKVYLEHLLRGEDLLTNEYYNSLLLTKTVNA